jgi:sugar phosphate isomerase/epimerase
MQPGFMLYSLGRSLSAGTLTVPGALALMRELGAVGVDITQVHVTQYTSAEVRQMVADAGLVTSCYIGGTDLTMDDGPQRQTALGTMRGLLDAAAEAGARIVLLTTGDCAPGQDRTEGRRNVAAAFAELLPHARANGLTLTFEDRGSLRSPFQTGEECLECCEWAGPDMKLTYDIGNMVLGDEDPVDFLHIARSRIVHAHAKDWLGLPADASKGLTSRAGKKVIGTVVGQGLLDYPRIVAALKASNYEGFLSFEYEGEDDPIQAAREGMAYLKALIHNGEGESS